MPLLKRAIQPSYVSRVPLVQEWVRDESGRVFPALLPATDAPQDLEAFANLTLANLITQLSSLSRHAEDLFGEMIADSTAIMNRTISLQGRVDKLAVKVKNLDSNVEEVSLQDIHMRKAFKSSTLFDQQVVSRDTVPAAMLETYNQCDQPPPLDQLNPYRDDGKDGLKFYTDPSYFFNLWREEMTKETEQLKDNRKKPGKPKGDGRKKNKVRQASNTRDKHKQLALAKGEHIVEAYKPQANQNDHPTYITNSSLSAGANAQQQSMQGYGTAANYPQSYYNQENFGIYGQTTYNPENNDSASNRNNVSRAVSNRPSQPPPAPPSDGTTPPPSSHAGTPTHGPRPPQQPGRDSLPPPPLPPPSPPPVAPPPHSDDVRAAPDLLPPPPPIPPVGGTDVADLPPPSPPPPPPIAAATENGSATVMANGPPPPPPPPPPMMNGGGAPAPPLANGGLKTIEMNLASVTLKPAPKKLPEETDPRSDLLKAIRDGIKLRKVDANKRAGPGGSSRVPEDPSVDVASILQRRFAFEVSDSESSSDSDTDSDDWDETSA